MARLSPGDGLAGGGCPGADSRHGIRGGRAGQAARRLRRLGTERGRRARDVARLRRAGADRNEGPAPGDSRRRLHRRHPLSAGDGGPELSLRGLGVPEPRHHGHGQHDGLLVRRPQPGQTAGHQAPRIGRHAPRGRVDPVPDRRGRAAGGHARRTGGADLGQGHRRGRSRLLGRSRPRAHRRQPDPGARRAARRTDRHPQRRLRRRPRPDGMGAGVRERRVSRHPRRRGRQPLRQTRLRRPRKGQTPGIARLGTDPPGEAGQPLSVLRPHRRAPRHVPAAGPFPGRRHGRKAELLGDQPQSALGLGGCRRRDPNPASLPRPPTGLPHRAAPDRRRRGPVRRRESRTHTRPRPGLEEGRRVPLESGQPPAHPPRTRRRRGGAHQSARLRLPPPPWRRGATGSN